MHSRSTKARPDVRPEPTRTGGHGIADHPGRSWQALHGASWQRVGGAGGVQARPTAAEARYAQERHTPALSAQTQHEHLASQNRANFASENHGRPAIAATAKPGDFSEHSAVAARSAGGEYHSPAMSPKQARAGTARGDRGASNDGFHSFHEAKNNASESRNNEARFSFAEAGFSMSIPKAASIETPLAASLRRSKLRLYSRITLDREPLRLISCRLCLRL